MTDHTIIFVYDHFYPDFTAGGPVTALGNLSMLVKDKLNIRILTSSFEYKTKAMIALVDHDSWTLWNKVPIWYASNKYSIERSFNDLPSKKVTIYLNGIFSFTYFLFILRVARKKGFEIVITPRGMLQQGALKRGRIKKIFYISMLKLSGLLKNAQYHSTDLQESLDIKKWLGSKRDPMVIPDIPLINKETVRMIEKHAGSLHLVYFSLITEKKNLLFILNCLNVPSLLKVTLDIIGPIKDQDYWENCKSFISKMANPERINYQAEISPETARKVLPNYHCLVLSTQGENFGHVIIEMLASSRPVIISDKTPWNDVEDKGTGYALPLQTDLWINALQTLLKWGQDDFNNACSSAFMYYQDKFDFEKLKSDYIKLFTSNEPQ